MREPGRLKLALCAVIALPLAALPACASTVAPSHASTARGGTLRVVDPMTGFPTGPVPNATTLDPQLGGFDTTELDRCCLARTLLSYNGQPTSKGGGDLRPDLAAAMPDVSADGLTWTFRLKTGLHYAPPYQSTEIVSGDFKRALARTARLVIPTPTFYSVIQGFDEYAAGTTASISGLETPDPRTLVVRLRQAAGDLGYRLSLSFAAPIPPLRRDPGAPFGVYTGHDTGIGGLVVSSGPYMIDGADTVDLESPVAQQREPHGFVTGKSVTLVRNPSWSPSSDALRPALADRIVIDFTLDGTQAAAAVDANRADIVMSTDAPPQAPFNEISAYEANPSRGRVEVDAGDGIRYISMNLAAPPFDDVHVRRAVAYIIDRSALVAAHGGAVNGAATGHIALDSLEDDALLALDPYRDSSFATRLQLASQEMAQSRYDSTHSGHCDSPVCQHVVALTIIGGHHPAAFGTIVRDDLALIGINLDIRNVPGHTFFQTVGDPTTRTPMAIGWGWRKDYPNGSDFFTGLFTNEAIAAGNGFSLLGATPDELRQWGYGVSSVPSVDDRIDLCLPLVGGAQARCWAALDEYMTEQVIAILPIVTEGYIEVIPARISAYSFDQAFDLPALDRIAVDP